MADADNLFDRVREELGEPTATYGIGPDRFRAKLAVGLGLILGGIGLLVLVFGFGLAQFAGFFHKFLVLLPVSGVLVLWNLYRARGLHVLVYPTGLLRFQRGEVVSFPWNEVAEVRLKADQGSVELIRDPSGRVDACWIAVTAPLVQVWRAGLTLVRTDGTTAKLTPAITGYPDLVERVQRVTFVELGAAAGSRYRAGEAVAFGPLTVGWGGLIAGDKTLPWPDVAEVAVTGKNLVIKRAGKWLAWGTYEIEHVPNPHVLIALIAEARRATVPARKAEPIVEDAT